MVEVRDWPKQLLPVHAISPVNSKTNSANRCETNLGRDVGKGNHKRMPPKYLGANYVTNFGCKVLRILNMTISLPDKILTHA